MTFNSNNIEEEFIEARNNWNLEKLYIDLADAKGKGLTPVEKKFLRGLLCGYSPGEIADTVYQSRTSSTVRVYLSNGLYKYMEEMLSNYAGDVVKIKNWSRVTHLLEKAGYKKHSAHQSAVSHQPISDNFISNHVIADKSAKKQDWGEATDASLFYGRKQELEKLEKWIVTDRCRLVVLLGMGGIGKSALSIKLAEQIQLQFDYVIWRSLRLSPTLEVILEQLLEFLSPQTDISLSTTFSYSISQLIKALRSSRCLIILDSFDSILESNQQQTPADNLDISKNKANYILPPIRYRPGYEVYGELIRRLGDSRHQSCLLLTSREKPPAISSFEGENLPVRSLKLSGLGNSESWEIMKTKGFTNSSAPIAKELIKCYAGNPLFLKLVATAIQELFGGNIHDFLEQGTLVFGDIRDALDQQFNRLSDLEKQIICWLAVNQDFVSVSKLQKDIVPRVSQRLILEAIDLLQRRCLIVRQANNFIPTPVMMEYIAERLIEHNFKTNQETQLEPSIDNTLFEVKLKNYIRETLLNAEM
ncbi:MAG: NB-ARC domain-containing protein [Nostocaceae cyanobacterium]|nr:NB-ARC domain-containing protein [Nostocaceae cyanobacterium]